MLCPRVSTFEVIRLILFQMSCLLLGCGLVMLWLAGVRSSPRSLPLFRLLLLLLFILLLFMKHNHLTQTILDFPNSEARWSTTTTGSASVFRQIFLRRFTAAKEPQGPIHRKSCIEWPTLYLAKKHPLFRPDYIPKPSIQSETLAHSGFNQIVCFSAEGLLS